MDSSFLETAINQAKANLDEDTKQLLESELNDLESVFPFSEHEYALGFLLTNNSLSWEDYKSLRSKHFEANRYLDLFELAPRIFGQVWGEQHLKDLSEEFEQPSKDLDPSYSGEYDLWLDGIKVEAKACRAIDTKKRGSLVSKALKRDSTQPFWMNFQQLKLDVCDVFIFVGVWVDSIEYWILNVDDVKNNEFISHQHRGGVEYQIGIKHTNIDKFDQFKIDPSDIISTIRSKIS